VQRVRPGIRRDDLRARRPDRSIDLHHLLGQSVFDIEGDEAWGETLFVMHALIDGHIATGYGRYIDYFRRTSDSAAGKVRPAD
jgi:hypothetical protein